LQCCYPLIFLDSKQDQIQESLLLSHSLIRLSALEEAKINRLDLGLVCDDERSLAGRFETALSSGCDVLLTSGGVSMGDRDLVKPLLEALGTVHFGRVNMKPGKPLTFATLNREGKPPVLVFGLPGNPVSSLVTFQLFVLPALRKMGGWSNPELRSLPAALGDASPLKLDAERPEFVRARLSLSNGTLHATSTGNQVSSRLLSARGADCLIALPSGHGAVSPGDLVSVFLVSDLAASPGLALPPRAAAVAACASDESETDARPLVAVLTVSDRASSGVYKDESGPNILAALSELLTTPVRTLLLCVPDERNLIAQTVASLCDGTAAGSKNVGASLVVTTGGTGPAARDVTPEAISSVADKELPGFGEEMRRVSLASGVPTAILSRQSAWSRGRSLILTLPGRPGSVRVCLGAVWPAVPYCVELLGGGMLEGVGAFRPGEKKA
jgi:gephyrin